MTTLVPAAFTFAASFAWIAAIDRMSQCHEPWTTRIFAYMTFVSLVLVGGFGIVQIHQQIEPLSQAVAIALYCALETAGGLIGLKAWRYWRV